MERIAIIAKYDTSIRRPDEPQIIGMLFPICRSGTIQNAKRREGPPIEFTDTLICREVNIPRRVFLDPPNPIATQPVLFRNSASATSFGA